MIEVPLYMYTNGDRGAHTPVSMKRTKRVQRFRGGLVFKAHRLLYHSTLGLRVIKKKKEEQSESGGAMPSGYEPDEEDQTARKNATNKTAGYEPFRSFRF